MFKRLVFAICSQRQDEIAHFEPAPSHVVMEEL
jgi:hypothetical protein